MEIKDIHSQIDELIVDYLSDGLNPERLSILQEWIDASAENRTYFLEKQEVWMATFNSDASDRFNSDEAYKRFVQRTEQTTTLQKPIKKVRTLRTFWYSAAVVALLICVSSISYWQGAEKVKTRFTDMVVEAPLGSTTKIYLPDSTLVWLNAGSKIIYSQGFGVNEREITLSGEGYFEVTKNEKLTFAVKTDELTVTVLGTKFNFSNYPDDEEATVSLVEGKVLATNNIKENSKANLLPNQRVSLNKRTGEMQVFKAESKRTTEWTGGNLFFDEELLTDIIKELERNYDVSITLADDSLKTFRFYGSFIKRECRIEDILDMLESTGKIKYKIEDKQIELSAK